MCVCNEKHARWLPSAIKPLYPVVHVSFVVQDFQQEVCRFREQCADTARIPIADDVSSLFSKTMLSMERLLAASPREYKDTGSCSSRHPEIHHAMPCNSRNLGHALTRIVYRMIAAPADPITLSIALRATKYDASNTVFESLSSREGPLC